MMTIEFYGQQDGERVLYKIQKHSLVHVIQLTKVILAGILLAVMFWTISGAADQWAWLLKSLGLGLGILVSAVGWVVLTLTDLKSASYVTDRRLIRLSATTPWTVNSRSIMWDEVVKVKTQNQGFLWRILNVGSVIAHARSTVVPFDGQKKEQIITNDDIKIDGVAYYQDLGNYMEKVLYLFKKEPEKLAEIRPFVAKPRGKRY